MPCEDVDAMESAIARLVEDAVRMLLASRGWDENMGDEFHTKGFQPGGDE